MKIAFACFVLALSALGALPAQPGPDNNRTGIERLTALKKEIQIFETIVDKKLAQTFSNPYALAGRPRGFYLDGYGVALTFSVNISRAVINTPFGIIPNKEESPQEKQKRIDQVKEMLIKALLDYGAAIEQLSPDESIAVIAHFEDSNILDEVRRNKIIIVRVGKRDLLEHAARRDYQAFKKRVEIVEY